MAEPPSQKPAGRAAGKPRQQATEATAAVLREKGAAHGEDVTMNGPLYKRKSANVVLVRRQRRKDEGAFRLLASLFVENQIGLSFNLIALLFLAHFFFPKLRPTTRKFFTYSYHNQDTGKYGIGPDDAYFISFCIVLFTGLRAFTMEYILAPFAKWRGITKRKDMTRFSEQAWLLTYYLVFWPMGMYIYCTSKYFLSLRELWTDWPDRELDGLVKGYVLAQWSFWVQQILVIHMEERRKDHWQMFTHHIITNSLLYASYTYHHTRVGILVLVLMDVVDIFLPLAKCLKYFGFTTLCDAIFAVFMVSWVLARHVFYLTVCWSIYAHTPEIMTVGCYSGPAHNLTGPHPPPAGWGYLLEPLYNPEGNVCYTPTVKWTFLGFLLGLQFLTLLWLVLIVKVAVRVIRGTGADDVRSDDEAAEEQEQVEQHQVEEKEEDEGEDVVYAQEVGADEIDFKGWNKRSGNKKRNGGATTSGVSLPGHHSDRKELLGRIGCEKQVD